MLLHVLPFLFLLLPLLHALPYQTPHAAIHIPVVATTEKQFHHPPSEPIALSTPSASPTPWPSVSQCPVLLHPKPSSVPPRKSTASSSSSSSSTSGGDDSSKLTPRVYGGVPTEDSEVSLLPYIAQLHDDHKGIFLCSAVLVTRRVVLTAAHCFYGMRGGSSSSTSQYALYFGSEHVSDFAPPPNSTKRYIRAIRIHPRYSLSRSLGQNVYYDVARLTLFEDAPDHSRPIGFNANHSVPTPASVVRTGGYGLQRLNTTGQLQMYNTSGEVAKHVDLPVTNASYCRRMWHTIHDDDEESRVLVKYRYQFCAGYLQGGCGSCPGDSGGPVVQYDHDDQPVLVGISSLAVLCGSIAFPSVYVRVSRLLDVIDDFLPVDDLRLVYRTKAVVLSDAQLKDPSADPLVADNMPPDDKASATPGTDSDSSADTATDTGTDVSDSSGSDSESDSDSDSDSNSDSDNTNDSSSVDDGDSHTILGLSVTAFVIVVVTAVSIPVATAAIIAGVVYARRRRRT